MHKAKGTTGSSFYFLLGSDRVLKDPTLTVAPWVVPTHNHLPLSESRGPTHLPHLALTCNHLTRTVTAGTPYVVAGCVVPKHNYLPLSDSRGPTLTVAPHITTSHLQSQQGPQTYSGPMRSPPYNHLRLTVTAGAPHLLWPYA